MIKADTHFSGDAARRARKAQQKGREDPMRQRPLALGQQRVSEVVAGAPTAVAPVTFQSWSLVVRAPGPNVVALTPGTVERTIFPPQCVDVRVTLIGVEELMYVRENGHG